MRLPCVHDFDLSTCPKSNTLLQWRSGIALKTGRRDLPCSTPVRVCRLSYSEFSAVFSEISRKYGRGSLKKTPTDGTPPIILGFQKRTIGLQPNTQPNPKSNTCNPSKLSRN